MSDPFGLPISLEARAQMIADEVNRIEWAGDPSRRKDEVKKAALRHLREAYAQTVALRTEGAA